MWLGFQYQKLFTNAAGVERLGVDICCTIRKFGVGMFTWFLRKKESLMAGGKVARSIKDDVNISSRGGMESDVVTYLVSKEVKKSFKLAAAYSSSHTGKSERNASFSIKKKA